MIWLRLAAHRRFTVAWDNGGVLIHWHREDGYPEAHAVGPYRPYCSLDDMEEAAAEHLEGHGPLQEDDGEIELPGLS